MKNKNWKYTVYLVVVFGALIAIFLGLSIAYYQYEIKLKENNKITKGVVLKRQHRRSSDVYVEYQFLVGSRSYSSYQQVNNYEYINNCLFEPGDSLIIIYYPPDPEISKLNLDSSCAIWKSSFKIKINLCDSILLY